MCQLHFMMVAVLLLPGLPGSHCLLLLTWHSLGRQSLSHSSVSSVPITHSVQRALLVSSVTENPRPGPCSVDMLIHHKGSWWLHCLCVQLACGTRYSLLCSLLVPSHMTPCSNQSAHPKSGGPLPMDFVSVFIFLMKQSFPPLSLLYCNVFSC